MIANTRKTLLPLIILLGLFIPNVVFGADNIKSLWKNYVPDCLLAATYRSGTAHMYTFTILVPRSRSR